MKYKTITSHTLSVYTQVYKPLKMNTMQLETPGDNHCCLMEIVYGQFK